MPHSPVVHRRVTRWANIAIFITVLAISFIGDGLRDALDPRRVM